MASAAPVTSALWSGKFYTKLHGADALALLNSPDKAGCFLVRASHSAPGALSVVYHRDGRGCSTSIKPGPGGGFSVRSEDGVISQYASFHEFFSCYPALFAKELDLSEHKQNDLEYRLFTPSWSGNIYTKLSSPEALDLVSKAGKSGAYLVRNSQTSNFYVVVFNTPGTAVGASNFIITPTEDGKLTTTHESGVIVWDSLGALLACYSTGDNPVFTEELVLSPEYERKQLQTSPSIAAVASAALAFGSVSGGSGAKEDCAKEL
jgi:hypothetical protein